LSKDAQILLKTLIDRGEKTQQPKNVVTKLIMAVLGETDTRRVDTVYELYLDGLLSLRGLPPKLKVSNVNGSIKTTDTYAKTPNTPTPDTLNHYPDADNAGSGHTSDV